MWVSPSRAAQTKGNWREKLPSPFACLPLSPSGESFYSVHVDHCCLQHCLTDIRAQLLEASNMDLRAVALQESFSLWLLVRTVETSRLVDSAAIGLLASPA